MGGWIAQATILATPDQNPRVPHRPRSSRPRGGAVPLAWLAALALAGSALPLLLPALLRTPLLAPLAPSLPLPALVHPGPAGLEGVAPEALLQQLAAADQAWVPRLEQLPDGRSRYAYQHRRGDPPLSLEEIRALRRNPPTFDQERQAIVQLLDVLAAAGVRIQITAPRKDGAAGEWDPRQRTLRIKPSVLERGSAEFAAVLNHEAIHVAQSCSQGHVSASPRPLGIDDRLPATRATVLTEPLYLSASSLEQHLEREAYANQHRLELGVELVRFHCPLAKESAPPGQRS